VKRNSFFKSVYLSAGIGLIMKQLDIYIRLDDLEQVVNILKKHARGITFSEVTGTGDIKREQVPEMVRI
jgi:nitrogen regulatory protein PII